MTVLCSVLWQILEFDPETKAVSLVGSVENDNYTWHGGVRVSDGRIISLPYNAHQMVVFGENWPQLIEPSAKRNHLNGRG